MMDEMRLGPGAAAKFGGAALLVLFLCWQHVTATRLGYRVESARRAALQAASRVSALNVQLEERLTPAEVADRASRLGMVPASPDALRRLPEDQSSRTASDAFRRLTRRLSAVAASRS